MTLRNTWRLAIGILLLALAGGAQQLGWQSELAAARQAAENSAFDKAERHFLAAVEGARREEAAAGSIAEIIDELGNLCLQRQNYGQAEDRYREALEIRRTQLGVEDASVGTSLDHLGHVAWRQDRLSEAREHYTSSLSIRRKALGDVHVDVVDTYLKLGRIYLAEANVKAADRCFEEAVRLRFAALGEEDAEVAETLDEISFLYDAHGDTVTAEAFANRGLRLREKVWGPRDPRLVQALIESANGYVRRKKYAQGETMLARAEAVARENFGGSSPEAAQVHSARASYLNRAGRTEEAEASHRAALLILEQNGKASEQWADSLSALGSMLDQQGREAEAIPLYLQSLEVAGGIRKESDGRTTSLLSSLAHAYQQQADYEAAEETYRRLLAIQEAAHGPAALAVASVLEDMGDMYTDQENWDLAAESFERMVAIREAELGPHNSILLHDLARLAAVYRKQGRREEADSLNMRVAAILFSVFWDHAATYLSRRAAGLPVWSWLVMTALAGTTALVWLGVTIRKSVADRRMPVPPAPPQSVSAPPRAAWDPAHAPPPDVFSEGLAPMTDVLAEGAPASDPATVEPPTAFAAAPPAPEVRRFQFHGDGGGLFQIWVMNLLLTLATLGIYYFWGKVKVRRYLYEQTSFDGDSFSYHGTAKELLLGWLKALPLLVLILWGPSFLPLLWESPHAMWVGPVAAMALMLLLWPLALVGARRYRLSRSAWRGIRFSFRGRRRDFMALFWGGSFLWLLTLGFASPFYSVWTHNYFVNHSYFGNARFDFRGHGRDLLGSYLLAVLFSVLTFGIYWFWYEAERERYLWSRTTIGPATIRCTLQGGQLFRLAAGNFLLLVFTLGLGWSWVLARRTRVWLENMHIEGPLDAASIMQDAQGVTATAEGFADFLGMDFGV